MTLPALVDVGDIDRRTYIGSSDAAAILGLSPYKTKLDIYLDKTVGPEEVTDPAKLKVFRRGSRMEPYIIDLLAEEAGIKILHRGRRFRDTEHPFLAAEIDAEPEDPEENIEIKTVSPFAAKEWGELQSEEIPIHYQAQAMHAMMVTRKKRTTFGVLIGGDDFRIYRLERDEDTIAWMREKEVEFWGMVQRRQQPEPTKLQDVIRLYGKKSTDKEVEASEDLLSEVLRLKRLKEDAKATKEYIEECEEKIKLAMLDASILVYKGSPIITWKTHQSSRLDGDALETQYPEIYTELYKKHDVRTMRIKLK